jgi:excisionase family DNA binding protein
VRGIHAYRSAEKDGEWLTMSEAAKMLGVSNHAIRRVIKDGILAAEQVVPDAPYQIRASDLRGARRIGKGSKIWSRASHWEKSASSCRSRSRGWRATARIGIHSLTYAVIAVV